MTALIRGDLEAAIYNLAKQLKAGGGDEDIIVLRLADRVNEWLGRETVVVKAAKADYQKWKKMVQNQLP